MPTTAPVTPGHASVQATHRRLVVLALCDGLERLGQRQVAGQGAWNSALRERLAGLVRSTKSRRWSRPDRIGQMDAGAFCAHHESGSAAPR